MQNILSSFQEDLILSLFSENTRIIEAKYFQEDYLPCPVRISVVLGDGRQEHIVLRIARHGRYGVETEAKLYPILAQFGLPVPTLLAGPVYDPEGPNIGPVTVLSLLPGDNLQVWSQASLAGLKLASRLVIEAVERLHQITQQIGQTDIAGEIPRQDMASELALIQNKAGPWLEEPEFKRAVEILRPVVASIDTPLSFSNGDYQPGNFLSDGEKLTGFVDFEGACFEDPHIGFAKYRIYDMHPLNKAGLVNQYLKVCGLSESDFAPRMALRCLWTLQREISVSGQKDENYRNHVKNLLSEATKFIQDY
jgi:aminoglycoside phosphotransferase (APT) family kinase protein